MHLKTLIQNSENPRDNDGKLQKDFEKAELSNGENEDVEDNSSKASFSKVDLTDLNLDKLALEYNSIELNWKSSRKSCLCSECIDNSCAKVYCSRCGEIYCERCSENGKQICNQISTKPIFICQTCSKRFSLD